MKQDNGFWWCCATTVTSSNGLWGLSLWFVNELVLTLSSSTYINFQYRPFESSGTCQIKVLFSTTTSVKCCDLWVVMTGVVRYIVIRGGNMCACFDVNTRTGKVDIWDFAPHQELA